MNNVQKIKRLAKVRNKVIQQANYTTYEDNCWKYKNNAHLNKLLFVLKKSYNLIE